MHALAQLEQVRETPSRLGDQKAAGIDGLRVEPEPNETDAKAVAREPDFVELHVLVDVVQAGRRADRLRLPPDKRVADLERVQERAGEDARVGNRRPRPRIGEVVADAEALRAEPEIVRQLDRLLLVEIGGAEDRQHGPVAKPGETEDLAAEKTAPAAELLASRRSATLKST